MELQFEFSQTIGPGTEAVLVQTPDNEAFILYKDSQGKLKAYVTSTTLGDFKDRVFLDAGTVSGEVNMQSLKCKSIPGFQNVYVWYADGLHRMALDPDDTKLNPPTEPYRFYYGVDTEKLYMNISQHWEFIATLRHSLMEELEEDGHPQYLTEERFAALTIVQQMLADIEALKNK